METKNMIGGIVSLAVVVICVATIMMPVLSDATTTHKTFTNEGNYYMTDVDDGVTYVLADGVWTVNGEAEITATGSTPMIVANDVFVRANGQLVGQSGVWTAANVTANNGTITGTATVGGSSVSISWACDKTFMGATDSETEFTMMTYPSTSYLLDSSKMYYFTQLDVTGSNGNVPVYIKVDAGTITLSSIVTGVSFSNAKLNWTAVEGYDDLYQIPSVSFDTTWENTTLSHTVYERIVPTSVDAEITGHLDSASITLLNAIPAIVIAGLIIGAVSFVTVKRQY